ncbi:MAG: SAM-dependent methyltransferase [Actinomycetota bacterium]|nr:SAM-dependent methyltransferase [Actinomycetota bacterium]
MSDSNATAIDSSTPSIARVYDYLLGGKHYYEVDRIASEAMIEAVPETTLLAAANRSFIRRAVRFLVGEAGIDQILDIGSGLPTAGNVHEVAQEINPNTHVVYVDKDPIVLANGRALLTANDNTIIIEADLREPESILDHPEVGKLIDFNKPLGVILGGILMHIEDEEDPQGIVRVIRDRLASGSYLVHSGCANPGEQRAAQLNEVFFQFGMGSKCFRPTAEQAAFLDQLEVVEPGLVPANKWRPSFDFPDPENSAHAMVIGGIGRKP